MTTQPEALPALIERLRLLPIDHAPDGWPAVRTREITALLDRITGLEAQLAAAPTTQVAPQPAPVAQGYASTDTGPISREWFTVVYRNLTPGEEVRQICAHDKVSAMSWSHALHDRDAALAAKAKQGEQP